MEDTLNPARGQRSGTPDKVPFGIKAAYGTGSVADGVKNAVFNSFLLFYYTGVLGLPGSLAGAALFLAMCFDAISDPLVGYLSDHTRSRWGRRHPWMYAAVIPTGFSVYFLLAPPEGLSTTGLFAWMTVFSVSVRLALTLHMLPRGALVPELTRDYDERTGLISSGFLMGWLGGLGLTLIAWSVIMPSVTGGRMNPEAYREIGLLAGVLASVGVFACALGTHRAIPNLSAPASAHMGFGPFLSEVRSALRNESFRMLLIGGTIVSVAANFQEVFGLYMSTYFWEFSDSDIAWLRAWLGIGALASVFVARPMSQFADKRRVVIWVAPFLLFWAPLAIVARFAGLMPENGSPWLLPVVTVHLLIVLVPAIVLGILISSMFADTIDESELSTGLRQEGVFGAANAFALKAVAGIGNLLGGITIEWIQFPVQAAAGTVAADKIFWLGMASGPGLMVFYIVGFFFLTRYRITRERYAEIRRELDARHGR